MKRLLLLLLLIPALAFGQGEEFDIYDLEVPGCAPATEDCGVRIDLLKADSACTTDGHVLARYGNGRFQCVEQTGGGVTLDIAGLPIQSSTQLADVDIMVIENVSESNVQRKLSFGSLANFLADGTTITATSGKLTAVGGGGTALTTTIQRLQEGTPHQVTIDASNDVTSTEHGLGEVPNVVVVYLVNLIAERGYTIGDRAYEQRHDRSGAWSDATHVGWNNRTNGRPWLTSKDGNGAEFQVTAGRWQANVVPYLLADVSITGLQGEPGPAGTARTEAEVQAIAGGMVEGNAESGGISLTYNTATQKIDAVVTGGGGTADGVVNDLAFANQVLTATRSESLTALTVTLPFVVTPDMNGNLRAAVAADISHLAVDHGNLRVGTRTRVGTTTPTVTYSDYSATGYRGTANYAANIPNPQDGNRMFAIVNHTWYAYRTDHWSSISASPAGWRGWYSNQGAAENHITAANQVVYWLGNDNVQHVDSYAPAAVMYDYSWEPDQERTALLASILPLPASTNVGQFPIVNATGDQYTTTDLFGNPAALVLEDNGVFAYRAGDGSLQSMTGAILESNLQLTVRDEGTSVRSSADYIDFQGDGITCTTGQVGGAICTVQSDEVLFIEPDDVVRVGNSVNHYQFTNHTAVVNGALYYFIAEANNTAGVLIRFGATDIAVLKAGEAGGLEALEGGEFETGELVGVLYSNTAGTMFWTATVLGNAAQRDVGLDPNELVALVGVGEFPTSVMPEASDAAIRSATLSKRVLSANSVDALFIDDTIDAVNPANESAVVGATQQKIAEALRNYGVSDVTLTGVGNLLTVSFSRPNGFIENSTFDLSLTEDLSLLEELFADLLEATGFHIGHDLVLADIVDARQLRDSSINIRNRSSRIHHYGGSLNIFTYSNTTGTEGIYYNEIRLADLPALQSSGNYGGGVRFSTPSDDVYLWIDGNIINVQRVGETTVFTANWRTLLGFPGTENIVLAVDSDEEAPDGRFYMMIYDTNSHVIRIGALFIARSRGRPASGQQC